MDKINIVLTAAIVLVLSLLGSYAVSADGLECPICDVDLAGYRGELEEGEIQGLLLALNDEYHAWAVYDRVLEDFGDVRPFSNILLSEETHIEALIELFEAYDVPVPENPWKGNVSSFESVEAAAAAGVQAEIDNVALYDVINSSTEREDILEVYASLQRASEENHLPAFQRVVDRGTSTGTGTGSAAGTAEVNGNGQGRGGRRGSNGASQGQRGGNQTGSDGNGAKGGDQVQSNGRGSQGNGDCDDEHQLGERQTQDRGTGYSGQSESSRGQEDRGLGNKDQGLWDRIRSWFGGGLK